MSKRLPWAMVGVLLLVGGCNMDTGPSITEDEQQAIRFLHNDSKRRPGTEDELHYLTWEAGTFMDPAKTPVRVVRVRFKVGTQSETSDILYRMDAYGKPVQNRLNGSGDRWAQEAQMWVGGRQ